MSNTTPLWEIDVKIAGLLDQLVDEDGVINEEAAAQLEEMEEARPVKIEACLLYVKNMRAMAEQIRKEEQALADRRRQYEAAADRTEEYVGRHLNGERFETPKVLATWRRSTAVEVDDGAEDKWSFEQSSRFLSYSWKVDKKAVKKALADGEEIPGARIVERNNMTVR